MSALFMVLDISLSGCKLEGADQPDLIGATMVLEFPGQEEAAGEVVWQSTAEFGIRFYKALTDEALARIVSYAGEGGDTG